MQVLKPKLVVRAGAQLDDWGTPKSILDVVRKTHGPITLDLASNAKANKLVQARRYFSLEKPCPGVAVETRDDTVWCNPPGGVEKVVWFFGVWLMHVELGWRGAFLIFNMDHWRALGDPQMLFPTGALYVGIPRKRLKFVGAPSQYNHPSALVSTTWLVGFDGHQVRW